MKGKRTPEDAKKQAAKRFHKGEDEEGLAEEFGVAVSTIRDWGKIFPNNPRRVKRKIATAPKETPTENTRVSNGLVSELKDEVEFWKRRFTELLYSHRND